MRWIIGVAVASVLAASTALAASPSGRRIVPGQSIAGVKPGDTAARVRAELGAPGHISSFPGQYGPTSQWIYYPHNTTLGKFVFLVYLSDGRVWDVSTTSTKQRTTTGIGPGATTAALRNAYPDALCYTYPNGAPQCAIYSSYRGRRVVTLFDSPLNDRRVDGVSVGYVGGASGVHTGMSGAPAHAATRATPLPSVATARRELLAELGVLRTGHPAHVRRQDLPYYLLPLPRSAPEGAYQPGQGRLDRPLVRTLRIGGYQVGLLPITWRPTPQSTRTEGLVLTLRPPATTGVASGIAQLTANGIDTRSRYLFTLPVPATIRTRGMTLSAPRPARIKDMVADGITEVLVVVPDGITSVQLSSFALAGRTSTLGVSTATSAVHDNVALVPVTGITLQRLNLSAGSLRRHLFFAQMNRHTCRWEFATYSLPATAQMVWTNASGAAVNTVAASIHMFASTEHPVLPRGFCPAPKTPAGTH